AGVADVELDQRPPPRLELAGPAGQLPADFVSDFGPAFAGLQAGRRHRGAGRLGWAKPSGKPLPAPPRRMGRAQRNPSSRPQPRKHPQAGATVKPSSAPDPWWTMGFAALYPSYVARALRIR